MPPFPFPLPTTTLLTFSNLLHDPSASFTTDLAQATNARTKLQLALKAVEEGSPGASALSVVDAVQGYLPYLQSIIHSLDSDRLLPKSELSFSWSPSLTSYALKPPLIPLPSIHAEHLFILLTYSLSLSNYAHSILASLPTFESQDSSSQAKGKGKGRAGDVIGQLTSEDEKRITVGLGRAVDLLCQASGVATYCADVVCPVFEGIKRANGRAGRSKWPVETSTDAFRGLAMMLLADAHVTAIRKLLLPILSHVLFAPPGPPLPSNHPSASLLAKLYIHSASLYDSALASFHVRSDAGGGSRKLFERKPRDKDEPEEVSDGEVLGTLQRYLHKESRLASALSRKWLGVDAGENSKGQRVGEALTWMTDARDRLEDLGDSAVREKMKGLSLGRGNDKKKEERRARKGRVERELEDVNAWMRSYKALNDKVSFQPIPPISTLSVPSGRQIFNAKTFVPPPNKFGSTFRGIGDDDSEQDHEPTTTQDPAEDYAGRGNYF